MQMIVPRSAIRFLLYQRSNYLSDQFLFSRLTKLGGTSPLLFKFATAVKERLYAPALAEAFSDDITSDYQGISYILPKQASAILDIGSGLAGIDVCFSRHYNHDVALHLLDKTKTDSHIYYGFQARTAFYNSQDVARDLLVQNGVPEKHIFLHDADNPTGCFSPEKFDIISSFISWGFHYPVDMYIDQVVTSLKPDGILIIDIRKGTDGVEKLKRRFSSVEILSELSNKQRVVARQVTNLPR